MEKELIEDLKQLHAALENDSRIIRLNKLEAELYQAPDVINLAKRKDAEEEAYSTLLSYCDPKCQEAETAQKKLFAAKLALDDNPLVKQYNEAYIAVRDLYMAIDDIIFSPFRRRTLNGETK